MAKQVCLCGAYPKKLSVCQYWLSWLASVAEMLLINNVSANEYQVWAVRGWFNGTQPLSWSEWPHVWNNLIIWNYLESTTLVLSTEQVLVCACAPLPFQPCTFRAVISLSLYTNHKHRDRRRERASLLCYFLLHKYITQESQTLHPSSPMLVSLVRFFSSLQGRMSKQNTPGKFINPRIMIFESIINYPKKWSNQIWSIKTPFYYLSKIFFVLSPSLLVGFLCMQLENNFT